MSLEVPTQEKVLMLDMTRIDAEEDIQILIIDEKIFLNLIY